MNRLFGTGGYNGCLARNVILISVTSGEKELFSPKPLNILLSEKRGKRPGDKNIKTKVLKGAI